MEITYKVVFVLLAAFGTYECCKEARSGKHHKHLVRVYVVFAIAFALFGIVHFSGLMVDALSFTFMRE